MFIYGKQAINVRTIEVRLHIIMKRLVTSHLIGVYTVGHSDFDFY